MRYFKLVYFLIALSSLLKPLAGMASDETDGSKYGEVPTLKEIRRLQQTVKIPLPELKKLLDYRFEKMGEATGFLIASSFISFEDNPQSIIDGAEALEHLFATTTIFANKSFNTILLGSGFRDAAEDGWIWIDAGANLSVIKSFIERQPDQNNPIVEFQRQYADLQEQLKRLSAKTGISFSISQIETSADRRQCFEKIEQLIRLDAFKGKYIKAFVFLPYGPCADYTPEGYLMVSTDFGINQILSIIADLPADDDPTMNEQIALRKQIEKRLHKLRKEAGGLGFVISPAQPIAEQQRLLSILEDLVARNLFKDVRVVGVAFGPDFSASGEILHLHQNASMRQIESFLAKGYYPAPREVRMDNPTAFDGRAEDAIDHDSKPSTCPQLFIESSNSDQQE